MPLKEEARAALEALRAQLVADGHPDEREPAPARHGQERNQKRQKPVAKKPKRAETQPQAGAPAEVKSAEKDNGKIAAGATTGPGSRSSDEKRPEKRGQKSGTKGPQRDGKRPSPKRQPQEARLTATQKRRLRRKRALQREREQANGAAAPEAAGAVEVLAADLAAANPPIEEAETLLAAEAKALDESGESTQEEEIETAAEPESMPSDGAGGSREEASAGADAPSEPAEAESPAEAVEASPEG